MKACDYPESNLILNHFNHSWPTSTTGVAIGALGAGAPPLLEVLTITQNRAKMHQKTSFSHTKKSKNFLERGHSPFPRPLPRGERIPLPVPYLLNASIQLDSSYATDVYTTHALKTASTCCWIAIWCTGNILKLGFEWGGVGKCAFSTKKLAISWKR